MKWIHIGFAVNNLAAVKILKEAWYIWGRKGRSGGGKDYGEKKKDIAVGKGGHRLPYKIQSEGLEAFLTPEWCA